MFPFFLNAVLHGNTHRAQGRMRSLMQAIF